jgi:hypothetical protein
MRCRAVLQNYVWLALTPRFENELSIQSLVIWERIGLFEEYGPLDERFTGLQKEVN